MCESNKTVRNYYLMKSDWKVEVSKVRKNKSRVNGSSISILQSCYGLSSIRQNLIVTEVDVSSNTKINQKVSSLHQHRFK